MPINKFQTQVSGFIMPKWAKFFINLDDNPEDEGTAWQWPVEKDYEQLRREKMKKHKKFAYRPGVHSGEELKNVILKANTRAGRNQQE